MQNQTTLAGVILPPSGPADNKGAAPQLYLDVLQALTAMATKTLHGGHSLAVSVLLGLVTLACRNVATNSAVSISQVLAVVPPLQIIRAVCLSLPQVADIEELHQHLVGSHFCAASLSLLQQLAVCASMHGVAQSEEMFSELLRLSKALSANSAASKVPDIDTSKQLPAGSKPLPQPVTGIFQQPGRAQVQRGTREHSKSDGQAGAGQKRAHDGDRSSGQPLFCVKVANGRQKPVPGHTKKGQRLRPAVMQVQVLRILSVFLSIPKPPTSSIVTVITTQHARLQQLLSTFNAFLFDEEAEGALLKHSLCAPDSKPPSSLILVDIIVPMHCVWLSTSLQLPGLYRFVVADVHHAF